MLQYILTMDNLIFYILSAEVFFLLLAQFRTNALLKRTLKIRGQKKEQLKQMKEEVKGGKSDIPVVKFDKPKQEMTLTNISEKSGAMDQKEMAVLQEMMAEFFG